MEYAPTLWRIGYDGLKYGSIPYIYSQIINNKYGSDTVHLRRFMAFYRIYNNPICNV